MPKCPDCGGEGFFELSCDCVDGEEECNRCWGEGEVQTGSGYRTRECPKCHGAKYMTCRQCRGSGILSTARCTTCFGKGKVSRETLTKWQKDKDAEIERKRAAAKEQSRIEEEKQAALERAREASEKRARDQEALSERLRTEAQARIAQIAEEARQKEVSERLAREAMTQRMAAREREVFARRERAEAERRGISIEAYRRFLEWDLKRKVVSAILLCASLICGLLWAIGLQTYSDPLAMVGSLGFFFLLLAAAAHFFGRVPPE